MSQYIGGWIIQVIRNKKANLLKWNTYTIHKSKTLNVKNSYLKFKKILTELKERLPNNKSAEDMKKTEEKEMMKRSFAKNTRHDWLIKTF